MNPHTRVVALSSVTSGTSQPFNASPYRSLTAYVQGTGTTSSGTIIIETADWDALTTQTYSGTWSELTTVNASDVNSGKQKAVSFTSRAYGFVRARIGTSIGGGGSVSVSFRAVE